MPLHSEPHARRAAFCWGVRLAVTLENTPGEETQEMKIILSNQKEEKLLKVIQFPEKFQKLQLELFILKNYTDHSVAVLLYRSCLRR